MKKAGKRAAWGEGRVAFTVLIPQISAELRRNLPKTRVYEKFKDRLGISYRSFTRLVADYHKELGSYGETKHTPLPSSS